MIRCFRRLGQEIRDAQDCFGPIHSSGSVFRDFGPEDVRQPERR